MSDQLVFMMGEFEARFPLDRHYAKNHMWAKPQHGNFRFGFTSYAVRLLQDIYFLDWIVEESTHLTERKEIGSIESKKAESALFAPMEGQLVRFNESLLSDPSMINVDKYEQGWLFEMQGPGDTLITAQEYLDHLKSVWEVTQRTIKGQLNN